LNGNLSESSASGTTLLLPRSDSAMLVIPEIGTSSQRRYFWSVTVT
jgi:hypothetical protein